MPSSKPPLTPRDLVGTVRRFGETGPAYVVSNVVDDRIDDEALLAVEIPVTGEQVEVPYLAAVFDPLEEDPRPAPELGAHDDETHDVRRGLADLEAGDVVDHAEVAAAVADRLARRRAD